MPFTFPLSTETEKSLVNSSGAGAQRVTPDWGVDACPNVPNGVGIEMKSMSETV
jgi:hypothetical protein